MNGNGVIVEQCHYGISTTVIIQWKIARICQGTCYSASRPMNELDQNAYRLGWDEIKILQLIAIVTVKMNRFVSVLVARSAWCASCNIVRERLQSQNSRSEMTAKPMIQFCSCEAFSLCVCIAITICLTDAVMELESFVQIINSRNWFSFRFRFHIGQCHGRAENGESYKIILSNFIEIPIQMDTGQWTGTTIFGVPIKCDRRSSECRLLSFHMFRFYLSILRMTTHHIQFLCSAFFSVFRLRTAQQSRYSFYWQQKHQLNRRWERGGERECAGIVHVVNPWQFISQNR